MIARQRRLLGSTVLAVGIFSFITCSDSTTSIDPTVRAVSPVTRMFLDSSEVHLVVGKQARLLASAINTVGLPTACAVSWTSSAPSIARVDESGQVTGVSPGYTQINASCPGASASAQVEVLSRPVGEVALSAPDTLEIDQVAPLTATIYGVDGAQMSDVNVTWLSGNPAVGTVSATGTLTGVSEGGVVVFAKAGGKTDSAKVNIKPESVADVEVTPAELKVFEGGYASFAATLRSSTGKVITRQVKWTTTDPNVAVTTEDGRVTAKHVGQARIIATSSGKSDTSLIVVEMPPPPEVASLTVTPTPASVAAGAVVQLTAIPKDFNGNAISTVAVGWSSLNSAIATVSADGLVRGVNIGVTTIRALAGAKTADVTVTVTAPITPIVARVVLSPIADTLRALAATKQLAAQALSSTGSLITGAGIAWSSSNSGVASVDQNGVVVARGRGVVSIIATSSCCGVADTSFIVVDPQVAQLRLTPTTTSLAVGASSQFTATPVDANGYAVAGANVTWSTSAATIATVSSTGLVTAIGAGTATITAGSSGKTASGTVTVTSSANTVTTVLVTPGRDTLRSVGSTRQLVAEARNSAGTVLTGVNFTWASSNSAVASVDNMGKVTAKMGGTALITLTAACCSASDTATIVVQPTVSTVAVTPSTASVSVGGSAQLNAVPKDANGVTVAGATISWATLNGSIATVNSSGIVQGVTAGSVVIRATSNGKTADVSVTVTAATVPPPPPPPTNGSYQTVIGDNWSYASKADLKASGGFWWYRGEDVWQHVDLVPDATFGQAVRATFYGDTALGWAPKYDRTLPQPLDKIWYRWHVRFSPGFTTAGPLPVGYDNSWKMGFMIWDGYGGRTQIAYANTGKYDLLFAMQKSDGSFVKSTETLLSPTADFGNVTSEWSDGEWYEFVMSYQKLSSTHAQIRWWRRRLTTGGVRNPGPWTFVGADHSNPTSPFVRIRAISLGANRNKNNPFTMYVYWGPWEVVDGSLYPNPFGMPNM